MADRGAPDRTSAAARSVLKHVCYHTHLARPQKAEYADEYLQYVIDTGVSDYKSVPGNLGVEIWRRIEGEVCHFWTVTKWNSYESIKKFAGEEFEKAKYYDKDTQYLLEFEPNVLHCETYIF